MAIENILNNPQGAKDIIGVTLLTISIGIPFGLVIKTGKEMLRYYKDYKENNEINAALLRAIDAWDRYDIIMTRQEQAQGQFTTPT